MRFFTSTLAIVAVMLSLAACTGKSSSNSDQSNATATSGAEATAASSGAEATEAASPAAQESSMPGGSDIPTYPGATATSTSGNMATQNVVGTVMTTPDSFAKVYAWYQKNMPAGSERAHLTSPERALFVVVQPGVVQSSVAISAATGTTTITIAHVKIKQNMKTP